MVEMGEGRVLGEERCANKRVSTFVGGGVEHDLGNLFDMGGPGYG